MSNRKLLVYSWQDASVMQFCDARNLAGRHDKDWQRLQLVFWMAAKDELMHAAAASRNDNACQLPDFTGRSFRFSLQQQGV